MSVAQVAKRASNRKGTTGVSTRYIREEIERGNLIATRVGTYFVITEEDFLAWEEKRGRSPGDEP
jgi:excisionase family DNA binding protein